MTRALGVPFVTPHCVNGGHQNAKVLSPGGALMPSCRGLYEYRYTKIKCKCWCHEMFDTLLPQLNDALVLETETLADNMAPVTATLGPLEHVTGGGSPAVDTAPVAGKTFWELAIDDEAVEPQVRRFVMKLIFGETEEQTGDESRDGRRRRGSLDVNVEIVCRLWLAGKLPFEVLTPNEISMIISTDSPPSVGAIYAVLTRWSGVGLCVNSVKPFAFVSFTPVAEERGIAYMKSSIQRERIARTKGFF